MPGPLPREDRTLFFARRSPTLSPEDGAYWQKRAEEEVELAQRAIDPVVVQFHYALTEPYLGRLHGGRAPSGGEEPDGTAPPARLERCDLGRYRRDGRGRRRGG